MKSVFGLLVLLLNAAAVGQTPLSPIILEPANEGQVVNPGDVHMATATFESPDPARTHVCSDWELWAVAPAERVWVALCATGPSKVHIHMGDGEFENSYASRRDLKYETDYVLRVRHRDDLGQWSEYAERHFRTSPPWQVFPLKIENVLAEPKPQWLTDDGAPLALPPSLLLRLEADEERPLLEFRADHLTNFPALEEHVPVRLRIQITDPTDAVTLPLSQIRFSTDHEEVTIYLPELQLSAPEERLFWVSDNGSTYRARWPDVPYWALDYLARGTPLPWAVRQPGFKIERVATGFWLPAGIAFPPNPGPEPDNVLFYVAELYGAIKTVTRAGQISNYAANILNFDPNGNMPGSGEIGIGCILVEPETGDLLVSMVYQEETPHSATGNPQNSTTDGPRDGNQTQNTTDPRGQNAPALYNGVFRLSSDDGGRTLARKTPILLLHEETSASHQISQLSLGPDGKLYVHIGDGFWANDARNLHSTRGKILRMNRDGSPCADNPFYDPNDGIDAADFVYALGYRNPFGGAWRTSDQSYYSIENGPSVDRLAKVVRGRDYLWDGTDASMRNYAIYNWDPAVAPVNLVFLERGRLNGANFPHDKMDHAFVSEFGPLWVTGPMRSGKRISEFTIDADGRLVEGPTPLAVYNGIGRATVVALAAGPDGLYFSDFFKDDVESQSPFEPGANIFRIRSTNDAADDTGDDHVEPPVLELVCPADLTELDALPDGMLVFFDPPEVRNARGNFTLTCVPSSGSLFPIGTTEVRCTATDESGLTTVCAFNVIVVAAKPPGETTQPPPNLEVRDPAQEPAPVPPGLCGYGVCGAGLTGTFPFTLLGLIALKANARGRARRKISTRNE